MHGADQYSNFLIRPLLSFTPKIGLITNAQLISNIRCDLTTAVISHTSIHTITWKTIHASLCRYHHECGVWGHILSE